MNPSRKDSPDAESHPANRRARVVAEYVEEALRPYVGIAPEETLAIMREILEETMATHPVALRALDALEANQPVDQSGTRIRGDAGDDDDGDKEGVA